MKLRHILIAAVSVACVSGGQLTSAQDKNKNLDGPALDVACRYVMGQLTNQSISKYTSKSKPASRNDLDVSFQFFFVTMVWDEKARVDGVSEGEIKRVLNRFRDEHTEITKAEASDCMKGGMDMLNTLSPDRYKRMFSGAKTGFDKVSQEVGFKVPEGFFTKYATPPGKN